MFLYFRGLGGNWTWLICVTMVRWQDYSGAMFSSFRTYTLVLTLLTGRHPNPDLEIVYLDELAHLETLRGNSMPSRIATPERLKDYSVQNDLSQVLKKNRWGNRTQSLAAGQARNCPLLGVCWQRSPPSLSTMEEVTVIILSWEHWRPSAPHPVVNLHAFYWHREDAKKRRGLSPRGSGGSCSLVIFYDSLW